MSIPTCKKNIGTNSPYATARIMDSNCSILSVDNKFRNETPANIAPNAADSTKLPTPTNESKTNSPNKNNGGTFLNCNRCILEENICKTTGTKNNAARNIRFSEIVSFECPIEDPSTSEAAIIVTNSTMSSSVPTPKSICPNRVFIILNSYKIGTKIASPTVANDEAVSIAIPQDMLKNVCINIAPNKLSKNTNTKDSFNINRPCFLISLKSNSNPIIKSKKYIPNSDKNVNVSEPVISGNGFCNDNNKPKNKAENTQGTRIISSIFPNNSVKIRINERNRNIFILFC